MLAWVHQSLASERELLISLFGEDGLDREGSGGAAGGQSFSGEPGDMPNTAVLLDKVFESICRPLKASSRLSLLYACNLGILSPSPPHHHRFTVSTKHLSIFTQPSGSY